MMATILQSPDTSHTLAVQSVLQVASFLPEQSNVTSCSLHETQVQLSAIHLNYFKQSEVKNVYLLFVAGDDGQALHEPRVPEASRVVKGAARYQAAVEVELAVGDLLVVAREHPDASVTTVVSRRVWAYALVERHDDDDFLLVRPGVPQSE